MSMTQYISNTNHYKEVLSRVQSVKHSLWIGTADIKDLYVETGKEKKLFLALRSLYVRVWRFGLFMQRSLARHSERTLTNTQSFMIAWSGCFVHVFTSRCSSLTARMSILAAPT